MMRRCCNQADGAIYPTAVPHRTPLPPIRILVEVLTVLILRLLRVITVLFSPSLFLRMQRRVE